ncbi:site-specific integrase [Pseudomonas sp. OTU5201]|uniref:site-specific integrase n=1 Tax=Pseudomonas sp. OTU5201 TaxID=3043850 RepID=UPI00313C2AEE
MQFYDKCCLSKGSTDEALKFKFIAITDKSLRNIVVANQKGMAKVANETLQGRIRRLRLFLLWLFDKFHEEQDVDNKTSKKFKKLISKIKLDEDALGKNGSQQVGDPEKSVIPDDVFVKLLEMVMPSSPNNPFKRSRVRNYLIVNLLIQGGIRRGALAKLKISDFLFYGTYDQLAIYRSGNDPTDPRAEKPDQKTKAHLATVNPDLLEKAKFYIDHIRAVFPRAQFHDFVFVSENDSKGTVGQPLSLKAINALFQKLSKALGFHLHPHVLRHKWNEIFDEKGELSGTSPDLLKDARRYAMGWSHNSKMDEIYNEKRLALKAREISRAHQLRVDQQK